MKYNKEEDNMSDFQTSLFWNRGFGSAEKKKIYEKILQTNDTREKERKLKGFEIASRGKITHRRDGSWSVRSQSSSKVYTIILTVKGPVCDCNDYSLRRNPCKHVWALRFYVTKSDSGDKHGK